MSKDATVVALKDRFIEVAARTKLERDHEARGWTTIMDRATGRALTILANSREGALWVIRALNAADRSEDRLSEDA